MLMALFADIHANAPALEAVLARAEELGAEQFVFLGDIVGYGPDPEEVTARVADLVAKGAIAIKGNHDEAVTRADTGMNPTAARAIAWTKAQLGPAEHAFLSGLPLQHRIDDVLLVHADASAPARWLYVTDRETAKRSLDATSARVTFCGHVHVPALFHVSAAGAMGHHVPVAGIATPLTGPRRWLSVCGAVGQPRDGNPAASFSLFDLNTSRLTQHRVAYDAEAVAQRVRDAGLPESLAARLLRGT